MHGNKLIHLVAAWSLRSKVEEGGEEEGARVTEDNGVIGRKCHRRRDWDICGNDDEEINEEKDMRV